MERYFSFSVCNKLFFFSATRFVLVIQISNMATVRSISPGKSPDRLLNRRLARPPTALSQRKITLTKTTPLTVTTVKRRKSSRTSSKKHSTATSSIPVRVNSFSAMTTLSDHNNDLIEKMASTTLDELPPIRRTSRTSDTPSIAAGISLPQINSDAIIDQPQIEEPLNDTAISNPLNETSLSSSSRASSAAPIEFTLDAFDTVRTVGTGKRLTRSGKEKRKTSLYFP